MAVSEGQFLLIQQGQGQYMLLRNQEKFHVVTVDKRLTWEREEKLLQQYPCSNTALRELGINFTVLTLRGVAASGCEAGGDLILYAGKKKYRYQLSDDYTQEQMGKLFEGIEKFKMLPKRKRFSPDKWRLLGQREEWVPIMRGIKYLLLVLSIGSCVGLLFHHPAWSIPGMLVSLSCGILDLCLPCYFTLLDWAKGSRQAHAIGIGFSAALPIMIQALYVINRFSFLTWEIHLWSAGLGLAICTVFGFWSREFSERTGDLIGLFLLLGLFSMGPIGMVNGLMDVQEPVVYPVTVEDLYISQSSRSGDNHYCTIVLKNGEEFDLQVLKDQYNRIEVGQEIVIAHHQGGLGLDYISLVEE